MRFSMPGRTGPVPGGRRVRLAKPWRAALTAGFCFLSAWAPGLAQGESPSLQDMPGTKDSPLTGRYEGACLVAQTVKPYDEIELPSGPAEGQTFESHRWTKTEPLRGRVLRTLYLAPPGRSVLEVFSNYRDALANQGFTPVYECSQKDGGPSFVLLKYHWDNAPSLVEPADLGTGDRAWAVKAMFDGSEEFRYALMKKGGAEGDTYVGVFVCLNHGGGFGVYSQALSGRVGVLVEVVEPKAMERKIVTVNAAEIQSKLGTEGRVSFYGIFFDFDKADLKPESEPQLAEMAHFLTVHPEARVFVTGHTDNRGALDYNLALSDRRARAVVAALASQYGIEAKRLAPRGLGQLAPLASNATEAGQAKNRRVEIVQQ